MLTMRVKSIINNYALLCINYFITILKYHLTAQTLNDTLPIVVVLWMLEGPTAGGAHAWAPFLPLMRLLSHYHTL